MSASFITHTIEDESTVTPSTPINVHVNLQQLSKSKDGKRDNNNKKKSRVSYQDIMNTQSSL